MTTKPIGSHKITTKHGRFMLHGFEASEAHVERLIVALVPQGTYHNSPGPLVRIQFSCLYSEAFDSLDCDCALQLESSLNRIYKSGGVLIYFPQTDARGLGLKAKLALVEMEQSLRLGPFMTAITSDHAYQDLECLKYVPSILEHPQIKDSIRLLSNNPEKRKRLTDLGVLIDAMLPVIVDERQLSSEAKQELREKRSLLGHIGDIKSPLDFH